MVFATKDEKRNSIVTGWKEYQKTPGRKSIAGYRQAWLDANPGETLARVTLEEYIGAGKSAPSDAGVTDVKKAISIDDILADSIAQLKAGKQGLLNQKDALQQQLKDIDAEIIKINAALEKLS